MALGVVYTIYLWEVGYSNGDGWISLGHEVGAEITVGHEREDNERQVIARVETHPEELQNVGVVKPQHQDGLLYKVVNVLRLGYVCRTQEKRAGLHNLV